MAVPQFDAVIDGLVATLRAAAGLGAPGTGSGVPVYDGPVPTDAPVQRFVAVGWDGNDDTESEALAWDHEFAAMGVPVVQDETGVVDCALIVEDGSNDYAALRSTAATVLGYVSDAVAAAPALGAAPTVWGAHLVTGRLVQGVSPRGAFVRVSFQVAYSARI